MILRKKYKKNINFKKKHYMFESVFGKEKDLFFMEQALVQAHKAADCSEVPVGAVVVNAQGVIIARAYNAVERDCTQRSHAESLAIEYAGKCLGEWRLDNCWVYVTLEPCDMCIGLIKLSRCAGVVYGASSPLFGFQLDKTSDYWVYKRDAFSVIEGVMEEESSILLKKFFQKKRKACE
jgi:tRNA(adenine34) deaminase